MAGDVVRYEGRYEMLGHGARVDHGQGGKSDGDSSSKDSD